MLYLYDDIYTKFYRRRKKKWEIVIDSLMSIVKKIYINIKIKLYSNTVEMMLNEKRFYSCT